MDPVAFLPVITKDLPIFPWFTPYEFLSRCKFSTLTTRQPMIEFYLPTYQRFPLRTPEKAILLDKKRTHDFRTSKVCRLATIDESGDEVLHLQRLYQYLVIFSTPALYSQRIQYTSYRGQILPGINHGRGYLALTLIGLQKSRKDY